MSITLRIIGIIGILLFGASFIFTYSIPGVVEDIGKDFIKEKIEEKTQQKLQDLEFKHQNNVLLKFASKLAINNEQEISRLKEDLQTKAHVQLVAVIAEMRNLDCECRKKYKNALKAQTESNIFSLQNANNKLTDFMKTKYMEVANKLKKDIRI